MKNEKYFYYFLQKLNINFLLKFFDNIFHYV